MARMTQRRKIHRFNLDGSGTEYTVRFKEDVLAAEEPLEIRIGGRSFAVGFSRGHSLNVYAGRERLGRVSSPPWPGV
jgi:formate dehydrogenase assembly factor FdhD